MALFRSQAPSYAFEELNHSLTALSTIPVAIPAALLAEDQPASPLTPVIRAALRDLSTSKPITRAKLLHVLQTIAETQDRVQATTANAGYNAIDKVMEAEIMARAVTVLWRETLDTVVEGALVLEQERVWWEGVVGSRFDVSLYFIQCVYASVKIAVECSCSDSSLPPTDPSTRASASPQHQVAHSCLALGIPVVPPDIGRHLTRIPSHVARTRDQPDHAHTQGNPLLAQGTQGRA